MPITLGIKVTKQVAAKTLEIVAKCSDCCCATLYADDGAELGDHDGYVPDFMPDTGGGDYINLKIDIETGQILNWKKPTAAQLEEFIAGCK